MAQIGKVIRHALELATIFGDAEVTLHKSAKLGVKDEDARLLVTNELFLDVEPQDTGKGNAGVDDVHQLRGDGAEDPRLHCAVHTGPIRISSGVVVDIDQDVVSMLIFAQRVEEKSLPLGVMCRGEVEDNWDCQLDVGDSDRLRMERGSGGVGLGSRLGLNGGSMGSLGIGVELRPDVTSCFKAGDLGLGRLEESSIALGGFEASDFGVRCFDCVVLKGGRGSGG
jgi:hypothetical protein